MKIAITGHRPQRLKSQNKEITINNRGKTMNITTFYPAVFVDDMDAALTKYEDMGFSRIHTLESGYFTLHVMKLNDCRLDIFTSDVNYPPLNSLTRI
jgi:trimethylamine:corrinoid methyltransferase-like protein